MPHRRPRYRVSVQTACPLDCPDGCSLRSPCRKGRHRRHRRRHANPVTQGYICAKVRRFHERVYGDARLRFPMARSGPQAIGRSSRACGWDEALDLIVEKLGPSATRMGRKPSSLLLRRIKRLDDAGQPRRGAVPPARRVATRAHGVRGADRRREHGALRQDAVGHLRGLPGGAAGRALGHEPVDLGHPRDAVPKEVQKRGGRRLWSSIRARRRLRGTADLHLPVRPGTDVAVALALHRCSSRKGTPITPSSRRTRRAPTSCGHARRSGRFERGGRRGRHRSRAAREFADLYATSSPALIRCGWGLERNRNGGNAACRGARAAAVGGKFGVRGGGYAMSNSASWDITRPWLRAEEPATRVINMNRLGRVLTEPPDPPVKLLFVYNCNPGGDDAGPAARHQGLRRDDLFTVVFDQVIHRHRVLRRRGAARHDVPRELRLLEGLRPAVVAARPRRGGPGRRGAIERRRVRRDCAAASASLEEGEPAGELDLLLDVMRGLPPHVSGSDWRRPRGRRAVGTDARSSSWTCSRGHRTGRSHLFPEALEREAPLGLYRYQPDPATAGVPARAHLAGQRTDGQLHARRTAAARGEAASCTRTMRRRGGSRTATRCAPGTRSARCTARVQVGAWVRPGTVMLPKGLWRKNTANGNTATTLVPDTLTDLGGGACFNDARVQVALVPDA